MDFQTEELTQQVGRTARDFALQAIKPHVMDWDEKQEFPIASLQRTGKTGPDGRCRTGRIWGIRSFLY